LFRVGRKTSLTFGFVDNSSAKVGVEFVEQSQATGRITLLCGCAKLNGHVILDK
jgi:hypothetical protein